MADNVQITEGSGTAVHADEFTDSTYGPGKSQQVKVADGTPGSGNKLIVNASGEATVKATDSDALLTTIDADTSTIAGAVAGTEMQVDVLTVPNTVAENAPALGDLAGLAGRFDSPDRLGVSGDRMEVAVTEKGILKIAATNTDGDAINPDTTSIKGPAAITAVDSLISAAVDIAAAQTASSLVAAPGANKQIWVYGAVLKTNGTTATILLQDGTPTNKTGTITLTDSDGFVLPPSGNFEMPWIKCATNTALEADTTGSGTVDGIITYAIVDVT